MKAVRMLKTEKGFSLIELMIVVAIIGILATVAIPNFSRFQAKAKQSEAKATLASMLTAQKAYFSEWNSYQADMVAAGYRAEGHLKYLAGFNADVAYTPVGYTGVPRVATNFNTAGANGLCVVTGAAPTTAEPCVNDALSAAGAALLTITTAAVPNALTGNAALFTVAAEGKLITAVLDTWTMDQNKTVANTISGL